MPTYSKLIYDATSAYLGRVKAVDEKATSLVKNAVLLASRLAAPYASALNSMPSAREVASAHLDSVDRLVAAHRALLLRLTGAATELAVAVPAQPTSSGPKVPAGV